MQNHVIDPTFFYDAIEVFAFNYEWYVVKEISLDELGRRITQFDKLTIRGSLQSQGTSLNLSTSGNTETMRYRFYCKRTFSSSKFNLYIDICIRGIILIL